MPRPHKCGPLDHISKVGVDKRLDRDGLWNANEAKLRKRKRTNPNQLYTGPYGGKPDELELKVKEGEQRARSDKFTDYTVQKPGLWLNLRILKDNFEPIADGTDYSLEITDPDWTADGTGWKAPAKKEHPKIANGVIKVKIPPAAQKGALTVRVKAIDTDPPGSGEQRANRGDVPVTWDLKIGALNPVGERAPDKKCTSGVQQRLNNLRFNCGPVDGKWGKNTEAAVAAFQKFFEINVDKGKEGKADPEQTQSRLKEVHDTDKEVTVPEDSGQVKDPSANVNVKKKLPTKTEDIGHVAPSYGEYTTCNTFVIRPEYRISLKLGEIENLFPWPIDSIPGRLARMQVLGFFYWPLNHRVAAGADTDPVTGLKRKPDVPNVKLAENREAYKIAWDYFKEKFCGVAKGSLNTSDADHRGEDELRRRLKEWVVQQMNGTAVGGPGGQLPIPAPEDETGKPAPREDQGHYAKIRFPGGWCRLSSSKAGEYTGDQTISGMTMYDPRYEYESKCYKANPVLGKIPLIAKVEKLESSTGQWKPASNVWVYFQLLKPYGLPAFDEARKCHEQLSPPPQVGSSFSVSNPDPYSYVSGVGPKYFTDVWEKYQFDNDNPQVTNCHVDCGGKRKSGNQVDGSDVAEKTDTDIWKTDQTLKNIFWVGDFRGFTENHNHVAPPADFFNFKVRPDGTTASALTEALCKLPKAPALQPAERVNDADHPHCVKAKTNDEGEAGVIFMPSRCGGDRYRLRAYIGPPTLGGDAGKGKGPQAVSVDTGTFVVWRNMRLTRWAKVDILRATMLPVVVANSEQEATKLMAHQYWQVKELAYANDSTKTAANIDTNRLKRWGQRFRVFGFNRSMDWVGLPPWTLDLLSDGCIGSEYDGVRTSLARGFCELDADPGYSSDVTQAEWKEAVDQGYEDAACYQMYVASSGDDVKKIKLDVLFFRSKTAVNNPLKEPQWKQITDNVSAMQSFCCPCRGSKAYDKEKQARYGAGDYLTSGANQNRRREAISGLIDSYFLPGFARELAQNGFLPGTTFIQAMACSSIEVEPLGYTCGALGFAMPCNAAYVMYGRAEYRETIGDTYSGQKHYGDQCPDSPNDQSAQKELVAGYMPTALHELGHCLFKVHAPGLTNGSLSASGVEGRRHDSWGHLTTNTVNTGQPRYGTCVMSYRNCEGMFCARCLLELRGWDILNDRMTPEKADAVPPNPVIGRPVRAGLVEEAPTELKPVADTGKVTLSWKAAKNAASYIVERKVAGGAYAEIATNVAGLTYTNQPATNGTTYFYRVRGVNATGKKGPYSNEMSATPGNRPADPVNLKAAAGDGQVDLSWNASANATKYNIFRRVDPDAFDFNVIKATVQVPEWTDKTVANGTKYYYRVEAENKVGKAANKSNEADATPQAPPAAPTNLAATALAGPSARLTWDAVPGATDYNVRYGFASRDYQPTLANVGPPPWTINVHAGQQLFFVVTAVSGGIEGAHSNEVCITFKPADATGLAATAGAKQVKLTWTAVDGATGYIVKRSNAAGGPYAEIGTTGKHSPSKTAYTDTGLTTGTTYYYRVRAVNDAGASDNDSAFVNATPT
jgi:fibronectin type 3 domain-containing protein